MFRRSHYVATGLVLALVVALLALPDRAAARLKLLLGGFFLPLVGLKVSAEQLAEQAAFKLTPRSTLVERLQQLQAENDQHRIAAMQTADLLRENGTLRQQLGWQRQVPWSLKPARVIGRDAANWWRSIQIDKGAQEGVRTNQPVLTPDGLAGRVAEVGAHRAQVLLVGDPGCRFSAWVVETRDQGLIAPGPSAIDPQVVVLTSLPNSDLVRPGQAVATTGLGLFPAGIPVGKIIDSRRVGYGMYTEARVRLGANLNRLKEVWVILP